MPQSNTEELNLKEYRQRRRLESLRRQLYAQSDPANATKLTQAIDNAELELQQTQQDRRASGWTSTASTPANGVLLSTDPTRNTRGVLLGPETTKIKTDVLLRMDRVPSGVAHLLDVKETPLVTFEIGNLRDEPVRLRITSYVEGFSATAVDTVELPPLKNYSLHQLPTFFSDRLTRVNEMTRASLNVQIDDLDAKTERQSTFPIWLMARTSAFNSIYDPVQNVWKDISYYYGAWVTPNVPEIMQLIRRAAERRPDKMLSGYLEDLDGVRDQVKAIFDTLKEQQILYIDSSVSFGATEEQSMQRVRLPRESLENRSANCLDGTVLMASLLEAASINPALVFVPGHAFLAWETGEATNDWDYLETTMISSHDFKEANEEGQRQAKKQKAAFATSGNTDDYLIHSLAHLRAGRGIYPME